MSNHENNVDCFTFIDLILPYLMIACFLLGFFIFKHSRINNDTNYKQNRNADKSKSFCFEIFKTKETYELNQMLKMQMNDFKLENAAAQ